MTHHPYFQLLWLALTSILSLSDANEKEIKLTFIYKDGKFIPIVQKDPLDPGNDSGMSTAAVSSVFLLLIIMLSFIGNILLIGTIASSITLKRSPFNLLLMNLGITCIIECVFNVIASVIYIMTEPWIFGQVTCNLNATFMELVPFIYGIFLLALMVDRYLAAKDTLMYRKYPKLGRNKCYVIIYWCLAIVTVVPIISGLIQSWPFPDRYSCQPMDEIATLYGAITCSLGYVSTWICLVIFAVMVHRIFQAERKKERKAQRGREQTNKLAEPALFMYAMNQNVHFWNEMKNTAIVVLLLIAYLLLLVPYIIRVKIDQIAQNYDHDYYRNLTMAYYVVDDDNVGQEINNLTTITTLSPNTMTTESLSNNQSQVENDSNLQVRDKLHVPEIVAEHLGTIDGVCVWLRYIHAVVVPVLIFLFHKDLRKKAEVILCCWRPNSVESKKSHGLRENRPISAFMQQKRREWEKKQRKFIKTVTNYNVPVLFASSEGLYLRLVDDNFGPNDGVKKESSANAEDTLAEDSTLKNQWSIEPRFVMEVCDLQLPMSASRGRTPAQIDASNEHGFGATVTVIINKQEPNLKSSLKKRPATQKSEEDEGFIDTPNSDPSAISSIKKVVQFNTKIEEIPTLEPKQSVQRSRHQLSMLPPLNSNESPTRKSKRERKNKSRSSEKSTAESIELVVQ